MNYKNRLKQITCAPSEAWILEDPLTLFYLTGLKVSMGICVVTQRESFLLVDSRYFERALKIAPLPVKLLENGALKEALPSGIKTLLISEETSCKRYNQLKESFSDCVVKPQSSPVIQQRMIKDSEELILLRNAAKLGSLGYDHLLKILKEGMTELDAVMELEIFWRRQGGDKLAFDPIIAFGPGSSMPHYTPEAVPLKQGDTILIDIGVTKAGYHSDMTRTLYYGHPHPEIDKIYPVVLEAHEKALSLCRPGTTVGELDQAAREVIDQAGYGKAFSHSLGHGIGLEVHELPHISCRDEVKDVPLSEGMVITIEPGIYLPNIGGVRIEDTIAITADGFENLTKRPKEWRSLP